MRKDPVKAEWIGRVIGDRYRITAPLGMGGMGAVYVAEHIALRKEVAIKVITPAHGREQEAAVRFAREAVTTAALEHPHIVPATDFGELPEGGAYLVMQLVRGNTLREYIDAGWGFGWRGACDVGMQVADAMAAAHAKNVVHRDLKPENILVELKEGRPFVRVTDFGIARILEAAIDVEADTLLPSTGITRVGVAIGTVGYMPPEQALGEPVDERADLYALGIILWELFTGEVPFKGEKPAIVVAQQISGTPPFPEVRNAPPRPLRELLARMLAPKPDDRPKTAVDVRSALRDAVERSVVMTEATEAAGRASDAVRSAVGKWWVDVSRPELTWKQRARIVMIPAVMLTMGLVATIALSSRDDMPDVAAPPEAGATAAATPDAGAVPTATTPSTEPPAPPDPKPTTIEKVTDTLAAFAGKPPGAVSKRIDDLEATSSRERRTAAKWLLAHQPPAEVPDYARLGAELETTKMCKRRQDVLQRMVKLGDDRALPYVERLRRMERRGCGFLGLGDCIGCIRDELDRTSRALD